MTNAPRPKPTKEQIERWNKIPIPAPPPPPKYYKIIRISYE